MGEGRDLAYTLILGLAKPARVILNLAPGVDRFNVIVFGVDKRCSREPSLSFNPAFGFTLDPSKSQ